MDRGNSKETLNNTASAQPLKRLNNSYARDRGGKVNVINMHFLKLVLDVNIFPKKWHFCLKKKPNCTRGRMKVNKRSGKTNGLEQSAETEKRMVWTNQPKRKNKWFRPKREKKTNGFERKDSSSDDC